MKLKPSSFRNGVKWLLILLIFHFVSFVIYSFLFAPPVKQMYGMDEQRALAYATVLLFECLFWLIMAFAWVTRWHMSYSDVRREILTAAKEDGFSPLSYFCRVYVKEWGWRTAFYAVLQLPLTVLFGSFGLALDDSITFIEKFYIADAGFYGVTGSWFFGLLLSSLYFYVVMTAVTFVKYFRILRSK